jgi:hypothetical protein
MIFVYPRIKFPESRYPFQVFRLNYRGSTFAVQISPLEVSMRKGLVALLFLAFTSLLTAQQALNNDSVIKMVKAGLTDDAIVATINANPGAFDASPDGLIALKQAGVSNMVIDAIVAKSTASAPDSAPPDASAPAQPEPPAQPQFAPLPPGVDNIGAYYKDSGGNWQPLPAEVVIFQSGGLVKHVASAGLVKEDLNGLVGGMRSRLVVSTPVTFILHVAQGRTASDYELIHLHVVSNNRQFQSVAGGLIHDSSTSSLRDEIDFSSKQIGPSAYQIVLNNGLGDGEFGFLAPEGTGAGTGADAGSPKTPASSGQIFTFAIVD